MKLSPAMLALLATSFGLSAQQPVPPVSTPSSATPAITPAQLRPPAQGTTLQPDASGLYTIRRYASLVVLDVVVQDAKGNIVTDLKRNDFHVTEAKEDQTILNFEETGSHLPDVSAAAINSTQDLDKTAPRAPVNIILLDEFNTRFEDMAFARYSLKKFLEKQPDKLTTPTMLLSVSLEKFTVLHDYTQNKQDLIDSLDHHFVAYPWQTHQFAWIAERYGTAFSTLMRVAEATQGHPGHKNMIWIGRGFPPFNFQNVPIDAQNRVNSLVQQCVNMLRDARITLYTIDPAGLQVNNTYGSAAEFNDPFGGNYQFAKLATATGGKALYGRNDVDAEIGTTVRDGASFYTLTYRPGNTSLDPQKFRKIRITLDRPGLVATTREGYYLQGGPAPVNPQNPSRRLAFDLISAADSTMVYDAVPISVLPSPTDPDSFTVRIDAKGLVWTFATDIEKRHADLVMMVTTFDKKGKELKRSAHSMKITAPDGVPPTGRIEIGTQLPAKIEHDTKAVRVRFVVRVSQTGRIGTADLTLPGKP
ncbi:VWA domain-containing protein [Terriglobus saanensis]|nr:VWA domain-containing protein [Terriglobus saanensis]